MNEWLKKNATKSKDLWSKSTIVQKLILVGVIVAIIAIIVVMARTSSTQTGVPIYSVAVSDTVQRDRIQFTLDEAHIESNVDALGRIIVKDSRTADRARAVIEEAGLTPRGLDPWEFLNDGSEYTITQFERDNKKQQAVTADVKRQIEALSDVSSAQVTIGFPDDVLFAEEQKPVTASVVLTFKGGSSMGTDRAKIRTVQNILKHSVVGLKDEFITISDVDSNILNNFEGLEAIDRLTLAQRELKLRNEYETKLRASVLKSLQNLFTADRIRSVDVTVEWDMSQVTSDKEIHTPIEITPQDPNKPYNTRETRDYLPLASSTTTETWRGTGYNPEGPAGVEGQNPPVYSDMSNVLGESTRTSTVQNNVFNTEKRHEEVHSQPGRRTIAVNIDGKWRVKYDKDHNYIITDENSELGAGHIDREYIPISDEELSEATGYVQAAIGYNALRGDDVKVSRIRIDREDEWTEKEEAYFAGKKRAQLIMIVLIGIVVILLAFIAFRFITREIERRKRLREEEILRRQQAEREKALWEAKDQDMSVTMSVEERKRAELQEAAIAMAKEHPEDVAMLLRTWLMDDNG